MVVVGGSYSSGGDNSSGSNSGSDIDGGGIELQHSIPTFHFPSTCIFFFVLYCTCV